MIRDAPEWLSTLIEALNAPLSAEAAVAKVLARYPSAGVQEVADALHDLAITGIVGQFGDDEARLSRHHLFFSLYGVSALDYDERVAGAHVGIVGTGGLGSTVAMLLAAAGIGSLTISDGDILEESNLTRSVLYRDHDLGRLKVEAAAEQLRALNPATRVSTVASAFSGPEMIATHFAECDFLVLTADRPKEVHDWIDQAARELGIPYINAGYIETSAAVGPFVIPGRTACYRCQKARLLNLGTKQLNLNLRAASYGPLNMLSAAIASHEIIRFLLGLAVSTSNRWMLMDIDRLTPEFVPVIPRPDCSCGSAAAKDILEQRERLAQLYDEERENCSLNKEILDAPVLRRALRLGSRVLDLGCGIGTLARELAVRGRTVTAVDVSDAMLNRCAELTPPEIAGSINYVRADIEEWTWPAGQYDAILLILALDYVNDPAGTLARCRDSLDPAGRLLLALPHPMKDSGHWRANLDGTKEEWVLSDYFLEGFQAKSRLDYTGRERISGLVTHKWSMETISKHLATAGLMIMEIEEPRPAPSALGQQLVRAAKLPYFLLLECAPTGAPSTSATSECNQPL